MRSSSMAASNFACQQGRACSSTPTQAAHTPRASARKPDLSRAGASSSIIARAHSHGLLSLNPEDGADAAAGRRFACGPRGCPLPEARGALASACGSGPCARRAGTCQGLLFPVRGAGSSPQQLRVSPAIPLGPSRGAAVHLGSTHATGFWAAQSKTLKRFKNRRFRNL
jgi:hypothetical protein